MKKFNLILCSFLFASLLFGQSKSKSTKSSISVSHHENSYTLEASFSEGLKEEVSDAIIDFLGKENGEALRNGWQWEKYVGDDLAYRFRIGKRHCEVLLKERFLEEVEYQDLIDFCSELKELMNGEKHSSSCSKGKEEGEGNKISINGNLDLNLSGKPVKMTVDDDLFNLNAAYKIGRRSAIASKIKSVLGEPNQENNNQTEWSKKSNGVLLYQFTIKNKQCEIFIDKIKMEEEEWAPLQNLGFSVVGKIL